MSSQAGVFYFDQRMVPPEEMASIVNHLFPEDSQTPTVHRGPGVILVQGSKREGSRFGLQHPTIETNAHPITFDGRIDNRADLLLRLVDVLRGADDDASLALAAYTRWGPEGMVHLLGDWSLAIWNETQKAVMLASDFAGVRPLYYCVEQRRVLWSTRLAPLVDFAQASEFDDEFIAGFLTYGACPNRTPYRNVYSIPPGHCLTVSRDRTTLKRFWEPPTARVIRYQTESAYGEELRNLFREAVQCRLCTDRPVIAELSGGLDSSSIVCMASDLIRRGEAQAPRVVSLSCEHLDSIDAPFYTAVEAHCGIESIHVSTDVFRFLSQTHICGAAPAFWEERDARVAGIARQFGAKTYLTGLLGDLIMGNWWDDSEQVAGALRRCNITRALRESFLWSKFLNIPIYWVLWRAFRASLPASFFPIGPVTGDCTAGNDDSISASFRKRIEPQRLFSQEWKKAPPERRKHLRCLMETVELRKLQPPEPLQHLCYTHPYAHRPLVEFMLSIPAEIVCGPGQPRRLMRKAFHDLWPAELQRRRSKDSFGGVFLDSVRPIAAKLANEPMQVVERGYVDRQSLQTRLAALSASLECNAWQLQQIILLELWLRSYLRREKHPSICGSGILVLK